MDTSTSIHNHFNLPPSAGLSTLRLAVRATPLPLLNLILTRVIKKITHKRPLIFARLQGHHHKLFVISITNLALHLVLKPNPSSPRLRAYRNTDKIIHDARIAGTFLTLLGMVDGKYDGDALFFTRDLQVSGDTEAIVCLRNALDDMEGSVAEDTAECFGALGFHLLNIIRGISTFDDHSKET